MGIVFQARHKSSDMPVALKTVLAANPLLLSSIRREVQRLRRLSHPGVVRILDDGTHAGLPWYAMELLQGVTLEQQLERRTLPAPTSDTFIVDNTTPIAGFLDTMEGAGALMQEGRVVSFRSERRPIRADEIPVFSAITRKLCDALVYIHGEGVVHRDVKPGNVFLRDEHQPVLVDFGLVLAYTGVDGREVLQVDSALAGTVAYMAPEQLNGDLVDARADIFALGCMLYEGLTGRLPFPATFEARSSCGFSPPPRPSLLAPAVEPWLDELVLRMLAADRHERLGHASDVSAALAHASAVALPGTDAVAGPARSYLYRASFAGRTELLEKLMRRARDLHLGKGELLLLSGESGNGKTRLLSEFLRQATAANINVVASECPPIEVTPGGARVVHLGPLAPLRPVLQMVADLVRTDGLKRFEGLPVTHLQVLAAFEPALADLPGVPPLAEAQPLLVESVKHRVLTAAAETIVALSKNAPLLLMFDDLQWADDLTLDLLSYLAAEVVGKTKVMVVGAFRSEEISEPLAALSSRFGVELISLGRLDEEAVGRLVADMLAVRVPPAELVGFVSEHAGGNPFFISEYLHTVVDEGLLRRSGRGEWALADAPREPAAASWQARLQQLELPGTLQAIVERRLRRLEAPLGDVVAVGALLGREFDAELLSALCPLDERALADAVNDILRRQILETAGGGRYRFTHDKLREVAYETIPVERRRILHRAAAEAIEQRGVLPSALAELANHFSKAEIPRKALEYLRRASEQALAAGGHQQAVPLLVRALEHADAAGCDATKAERAGLHKLYADALFGTGDIDGSLMHAGEALSAMGVPLPKTTGRWALLLFRQLIEQILRIIAAPVDTLPPPDEAHRLELALAAGRLSSAYFSSHQPQLQVMTATFLAANFADRAGPRGPRALPYSILGCTAGFFRMKGLSARYFQRARQDARRRGDLAVEAVIAIQECALHQGLARWDALIETSDAGAAIATQVSDRLAFEALDLVRSGSEMLTGKLESATRRLSAIVRDAGGRGARLNHGWAATMLGLLELWNGRPASAHALAAAAHLDFASDRGTANANPLAVEAGAALLLGDLHAAFSAAQKGVEVLGRGPVLFQLWPACATLTWVLLALWEDAAERNTAEVSALRRAALAACRHARSLERLCPIGAPFSARAFGVAARIDGNSRRARRLLEQAITHAQRLNMPVALAESCIELARTLPDSDSRRKELLLRALEQATALGVTLLCERANALLAKTKSSHDKSGP